MSVKKIGKGTPYCSSLDYLFNEEVNIKNFMGRILCWSAPQAVFILCDDYRNLIAELKSEIEQFKSEKIGYPPHMKDFKKIKQKPTSAIKQEISLVKKISKKIYKAYTNDASIKTEEYENDVENYDKAVKAYELKQKQHEEKEQSIANKVTDTLKKLSYNKPYLLIERKDFREVGAPLYAVYRENIYKFDRVGYSDEEMLLQIMDLEDEERRKFERLRHKFSEAEKEEKEGHRQAIPEEVRIAVWRRDEGKCVKCGSREDLEYDHIIPFSKGGNSTVRNIELLCEKCNREKHDNIQ